MTPQINHWIDSPDNPLKCTGYVINIYDDDENMSTLGPFSSPEAALDFLKLFGECPFEIVVQPIAMLKNMTRTNNERIPRYVN